ncbi:pericentriolar material 1 protein-like isoform X4 [Haliotis rubra]|uniref:pericentriolar material 1 protein-like isoform X4 n=1 Tax=Haliotis rubra TaxID=36100 RepID=UPI001EE4F283|nr:pericentriolar material 1 protein-like isoform X4 [Haliotis rubra]
MKMATGGMPYSKKDSKQRSNWQRSTSYSDRDDAHSLNSVPNDVRINNWDFSDWRPNSQSVDVKRRKKSKGNPEREREQSLSLDSPPHREGEKKQRTPSTFPRTKFTPSTPTQQRVALENLRQQLTFSDFDDQCSTDGEPNNERLMNTRKRHGSNYSHPESGSRGDGSHGRRGKGTDASAASGQREVRSNRNNNRDDASTRDIGPDSNQIVGRLMQIRDYIKQANSMVDNLKKRGDPKSYKEDLEKLKTLIDNLKEQERGYMGLLQRTLAMRDESGLLENGAVARAEADGGNKRDSDDTASVDLDVDTDASETTENTQSSSSRPRIEDKLGADSEAEESGDSNTSHGDSDNMDNTVIPSLPGRRSDWSGVEESGADMEEQHASVARQGELENLRRQEELLKILVEKQDQLKMLQDRQDSLLSMKNKCEKKLAMAQAKERAIADPEGFASAVSSAVHTEETEAKSNIVGYPESETEEDPSSEILPKELQELRRHLTVLKNELKAQPSDSVDDAEPSVVAVGEQILQDKLRDLQDKKQRMDSLLRELQGLRSHRLDLLNDSDMRERAPEQIPIPESLADVPDLDVSTISPQGAQQLREAQDKLGKLREVRERLNQLRDLVSYYQTVKGEGDGAGGEGAEQSSTAYSDYGADMDPEAMLQQLLQQVGPDRGDRGARPMTTETATGFGAGQTIVNLPPGPALEEHSDEENASDSESNKDSQLSSLGPWGDDPEIQEKVQKLRAAKEKLRQLQDIVAMVQQSPNGAPDIPNAVMELAASEEGEVIPQAAQMNDQNMSVSEGEIPTQDKHSQSEEARQFSTIEQQREELLSLREERERLMAVHSALQSLQDQFQLAENEEPTAKRQGKDGRGSGQQGSAPMVTCKLLHERRVASNDELYSKMRKQRILREELRQKKKELEAIMRKDRNKKQYFRNQDNHSDTVSYSTDAFAASASADATMATWGGSTVDNLGSITEDEDGNDPEAGQDDDDGYPSDGIVQVEEEEEENDSDGTYTIEDDARQRRSERSRRSKHQSARPKLTKASVIAAGGGHGCPRPMRKQEESVRPKQPTRVQKKKGKLVKRDVRVKQENYRSAEEIVQEEEQSGQSLGMLQQQLERTSQMCQALLLDQQSASPSQGMMSPSGFSVPMRGGNLMPDMMQQQIQQQQLMLCLNQCYQQLGVQQVEMQNIQQQLHGLSLQVTDSCPQPSLPVDDDRENQRPSPLQSSRLNTPMTTSFSTIPNSSASINMHTTRQTTFTLNPHFPSNFSYTRHPGGRQPNSYTEERKTHSPQTDMRSSDRPSASGETHFNNLRPIPPTRIDSYLQSGDRSYLNQQQNNHASTGRKDNTDASRAPRLNLQDMLNSRKVKQHATQGQSTGVFETVEGMPHYSSPNQTGGTADRLGKYRPGLSAGISGAGFHDSTSLSSILSARMSDAGQSRNTRDGDTGGDLSLFEALRETIYSEVATLISQNESRPHFLIELFRILQVLNSDYLRQRGLYAIQDLVSKTLTEENSDSFAAPPPPWLTATAGNCTPSELTPSESLATSDDEDLKARLRERVAMVQRSKRPGLLMEANGSLRNGTFDYAEKVENTSSLSTPSTSLWDSPFAQDSLGDTVIHFDKALEKMREYEKLKAEGERTRGTLSDSEALRGRDGCPSLSDHLQANAATMDQGSESSVSDMPVSYPRIDTNQLDQQIKSVMTEIMPVIKEHMDDACSPQLLAYIKRLVLSLTRQHDNGQEFARFFHRQLGSILQDSMAKFEGRRMRECGEEMLVDMSEVLFNELAFFRLMQDLDEPTIADKIRTNAWFQSVSDKSASSKKMAALVGEESDGNESSSEPTDDDRIPSTLRMTTNEEEDLGKDRDDELASEMPVQDAEEKDEDPESPYKAAGLQIELAVSETKPFTRIGSDEDEDEADESQSMEDPSETAVSRDNKLEHSQPVQESSASGESDSPQKEAESTPMKENNATAEEEKEADTQQLETSEADGTVTGGTTPLKTEASQEEVSQIEGQVNGEVHINGEINIEDITLEDLPASLAVGSPADLEEKLEEEQKLTTGAAGILTTVETPTELAGDGSALKEPESEA